MEEIKRISLGGDDMRNKVMECMNDLMHNNCICNYVIVQDGSETYIENISALDVYMKTLELSKNGNVECYMAALGKENKAVSPIFTVIDGIVRLSNCIIK